MAPKSKRGKAKGEKKKKDEKVLPVAIDIIVNLPDQSDVILKVWFPCPHQCSRSPRTLVAFISSVLTELYNIMRTEFS